VEDIAFIGEDDRGRVGHAGTDGEHALLCLCIKTSVRQDLWPRSDKAHVALQDVPQLDQLIEFVRAHESANGCNTPVGAAVDEPPILSALTTMERNLSIRNSLPPRAARGAM